jgi:hypothetical protein
VAVIVAHSAGAGDISRRRIDSTSEFRQGWIYPCVDDADLDALATRAGVVRRDRIRRD